VIISTGASDWIEGSGTVERVENGWLVNGRKRFCSGVPIGDYLLTGAVHDDLANGPTILHFPLSLKAKGVHILSTWQTLGMRGTGSHDVVIERVFVPDADIMAYRPQGKWHPVIHTSVLVGLPLIFSVYLGIAEAARDIAIKYASSRSDKIGLCCLVGEMENELAAARVAHADMVLATAALEPSEAATNRVFIGRTLVGRAAMRTVEKAMEVTGGKAFHRDTGLERLFRDVQAGRYHSPQEKPQQHYSGQVALLLNTYDD
jgi:acyl-CoA dehydrogenase